jgi:hypothetical protein
MLLMMHLYCEEWECKSMRTDSIALHAAAIQLWISSAVCNCRTGAVHTWVGRLGFRSICQSEMAAWIRCVLIACIFGLPSVNCCQTWSLREYAKTPLPSSGSLVSGDQPCHIQCHLPSQHQCNFAWCSVYCTYETKLDFGKLAPSSPHQWQPIFTCCLKQDDEASCCSSGTGAYKSMVLSADTADWATWIDLHRLQICSLVSMIGSCMHDWWCASYLTGRMQPVYYGGSYPTRTPMISWYQEFTS